MRVDSVFGGMFAALPVLGTAPDGNSLEQSLLAGSLPAIETKAHALHDVFQEVERVSSQLSFLAVELPVPMPFEEPVNIPLDGADEMSLLHDCVHQWLELAGQKGYLTMADLDFGVPEGPGKLTLLENFKCFASQQRNGDWGIEYDTVDTLYGFSGCGRSLAEMAEHYRNNRSPALPAPGDDYLTLLNACSYQWPALAGEKGYLTLTDLAFGVPDGPGKSALLREFKEHVQHLPEGDWGLTHEVIERLLGEELAFRSAQDLSVPPFFRLAGGFELQRTLEFMRDHLLDLVDGAGYVVPAQLDRRVAEPTMREDMRRCFERLGLQRLGAVEINQAILVGAVAELSNRVLASLDEPPADEADLEGAVQQVAHLVALQDRLLELQIPARLTFGESLVAGEALRGMACLLGPMISLEVETRRVAMRMFDQLMDQAREPYW